MNRLLRGIYRRTFRYDVFVAYDHADKDFLGWLAQRLEEFGFDVVFDSTLVAGYDPKPQIERLIRKSYGGIVLESEKSQESKYVTSEVTYLLKAKSSARPLIPVLLNVGARPALSELLWVDFRGIDIKDPNHAERRDAKVIEIVRGLRGDDGSSNDQVGLDPPWQARGFSLKFVFFVVIMTLFLATIAFQSLVSGVGGVIDGPAIGRIQQRVIAKEHTIDALAARPIEGSSFSGTIQHFEKGPGSPIVAADIWDDGRLVRRDFFDNGRRIAHDSLIYHRGEAVGKVRSYFDDQGREILSDTFAQDGLLIESRYCRDTLTGACMSDGEQLRSPLPPIVILRYR